MDPLEDKATVEELKRTLDSLYWLRSTYLINYPDGGNEVFSYIDKRLDKLTQLLSEKEVLGALGKE